MAKPSLVPAVRGLLTWLGVPPPRSSIGGATQSPSYCYGVWLKHLVMLWKQGLRDIPHTVVELGPGNSLGTGYAALLSGAERYIGIDALPHADAGTNERVLHRLLELFRERAPRPRKGWPDFDAGLDERLFPSAILTPERLAASLAPKRVQTLGRRVSYHTLDCASAIPEAAADLVFSHTVLHYVADLDGLYERCMAWLKPGGWMSHQIDFASWGFGPEWNAHLKYGERMWKLVRGRRVSCVNRETCGTHVELLRKHGFRTVFLERGMRFDGLPRERLAARWRDAPDEDVHCWNAFVIARKPGADVSAERVPDLLQGARILDRGQVARVAPLGERLDRAA